MELTDSRSDQPKCEFLAGSAPLLDGGEDRSSPPTDERVEANTLRFSRISTEIIAM